MKKQMNLIEQLCVFMILLIGYSTQLAATPQPNNNPDEKPEMLTVYIHAQSGLKLRAAPGKHAETLLVISYGDHVQIKSERNKENSFDNKDGWFKGSWIKVNYEGLEGYVYDGYVSPLPIPIMDPAEMDCQDPAHALMTYISEELDVNEAMDTVLNKVTDEHILIKITQKLSIGATGIYRQFDTGYSTELNVPNVRVRDGYNLMKGMFENCVQLSQLNEDAIFIMDKDTDEVKEVRAEGLKIKRTKDGGITIKCTYQYQATCCYVE